jgi:hypothetical protein
LVLILSLIVVRNSRSDLAASRSSFVMKVAYGRRLLVDGLWPRKPISGYPRRAPK